MHTIERRSGSAGFTLIELLIVTAILGLLAVFASHALVGLADDVVVPAAGPATVDVAASQAARLVQLAGVAVLLFGAGFWYLANLHRPGQLDRFRLGHFLLVALTYSLFFVAFAVLDGRGWSMTAAVSLAAAVSYPLVTLHVATITGWRFALFAALPLTAWTTGIVVNGVYGGELRSLIYLGMLATAVAFLTWTYPRLMRGIEGHREQLQQRLLREADEVADAAAALRERLVAAEALLRTPDHDEGHGLRRWLEQRVEHGQRTLELAQGLARTSERVRYLTGRIERHQACLDGLTSSRQLRERIPPAIESLQATTAHLASHREHHAPPPPPAADVDRRHCIGCGHGNPADARFCANCGRPSTERRECRRCAHVLHLPPHLLREGAEGEAAQTYCHCCGERHAEAG
jgi:prepilin-type N-terminal cleavage/methylation domain-containing protein